MQKTRKSEELKYMDRVEAEMAKHLQWEIIAASQESSVEKVVRDASLVSAIVSRLTSVFDRHAASLVCKLWNESVTWEAQSLPVRSRSLLPLLFRRFSHAKFLNFSPCLDQLQDGDLLRAASALPHLHTLILGHPELPQEKLTDEGFSGFVKSCPRLRHVALCGVANLRDSGVRELTRHCRDLISLSLSSCRNLTDESLDALSNCKFLKELTLKGIFLFTPYGLARVGENCPGLVAVGLEFETLDISLALKSLAINCQKLETLSLKFRHGYLGELSRCRSLVRLYIEADNINDVDIPIMNIAAANRKLKEFSYVNSSVSLGDSAALTIMHNCPDLERLCFHSSARSLSVLAQSGIQLKEINVIFGWGRDAMIHGQGTWDTELESFIRSNQQLEKINLQCALRPSLRTFSAIALCSNLRHLDLSFTDVDNRSLAVIANSATALQQLSLVKCEGINDMKVLSNFKGLEYLNLDQCPFVNDEGLDFLSVGCSKLTDLSLASTRITDIGLEYLAECGRLRTLRIPYCRGVQGPGLVTIAKCCSWLKYLVISHRFQGSEALEELKRQYCMVRLDVDDLALVPFGFYALDVAVR